MLTKYSIAMWIMDPSVQWYSLLSPRLDFNNRLNVLIPEKMCLRVTSSFEKV
jgi:hypothetical protein